MSTSKNPPNSVAPAADAKQRALRELRELPFSPVQLLLEFLEFEIPCPYPMNDGRLQKWQSWYDRVKMVVEWKLEKPYWQKKLAKPVPWERWLK